MDLLSPEELSQISLGVCNITHCRESETDNAYEDVDKVFGDGEEDLFPERDRVLVLRGTLSILALFTITLLHLIYSIITN